MNEKTVFELYFKIKTKYFHYYSKMGKDHLVFLDSR